MRCSHRVCRGLYLLQAWYCFSWHSSFGSTHSLCTFAAAPNPSIERTSLRPAAHVDGRADYHGGKGRDQCCVVHGNLTRKQSSRGPLGRTSRSRGSSIITPLTF